MRTVFITCFFGIISRDILGTDVLRFLRAKKDLRIVILVPESRQKSLEREFSGENVLVVGVAFGEPGRIELTLRSIFLDLLPSRTRRIQRLVAWKKGGSFFAWVWGGLLALSGRARRIRLLARWLDRILSGETGYERYFEEYQPILLFSTDVMTPYDVAFMRVARRRGIPIVGMVRSWDNLTLYGVLRIVPPMLLVQNEIAAAELVRYHDVPTERIRPVGIAHYDEYSREARTPREAFLRGVGLDPAKRTVFYAATADKHLINQATNEQIVRSLATLGENVLVRAPIIGYAKLDTSAFPKNVAVDWPANTRDVAEVDITGAADRHLADSLAASDVVIAGPSTLMVDGVVFGKPAILVGYEYAKVPYWQSMARFLDYDHIRAIIDSGGVRVAKNEGELMRWARAYLDDPTTDRVGRERMIQEKRWRSDGESARRIADALFQAIKL